MKTLSSSTSNAVAATVTKPGYLVQIDTTPVIRLSSRGTQSWDDEAWTGGRILRSSISTLAGGEQKAALELVNSDLAYSALALGSILSDIPVRMWKFYADNPAVGDPVQVFEGVIDGVEITSDSVRFDLVSENARVLSSPRRFIGPSTGFNNLRPAGTKFTWNGQVYVLERA